MVIETTKFLWRTATVLSALILISLVLGFIPAAAAPPQQATYDCTPTGQTSIPQAECAALVALYTSTNGTMWTDDSDWLVSADPCSWFGVTCNAAGPPANVIGIDLKTNNLDGPLPVELEDLTNLVLLSLSGNLLTGTLPSEIGTLLTLETLNLSGNTALTGPLPGSMTNQTALTVLNISSTDLCEPQESAFQAWLTGLTAYTPSGIDCEIDCAVQTSIPQSECLGLFALYNSTTGDSWTDRTAWLTDYAICGWYGLSCITGRVSAVVLPGNNLDGTLPTQIGAFPYMTILDLSGNSLSGSLPGQLQGLVRLQTLNISNNSFAGALPSAMGNLSFLQTLDLGNNAFTGQVPVSFANLTSLIYIDTTGSTLCLPDNANLLNWYNNPGLTKVDTIPNCIVPDTATPTSTPSNTPAPKTLTPTPIPLPTNTPTATTTATITSTPTMLGPFQTLTALALADTLTATVGYKSNTPTASATSYYMLVSQTLIPISGLTKTAQWEANPLTDTPTPVVIPQRGGISPVWWVLLVLAVGLIGAGVYLEWRRRQTGA